METETHEIGILENRGPMHRLVQRNTFN